MRNVPLAVVLIAAAAQLAVADDKDGEIVVKTWLVLPPVDIVARRPLRPDAVIAKHLLDRASAPPKEGEETTGTLGKAAKWATREADKDGDVEVEGGSWAYASVEATEDRVAIAKLEGASTLFVGGAGFTGDVYRLGDVGVPVALKKGANDVFVGGPRGGFKLTLSKPKLDLVVGRQTIADLQAGTPWSCGLWNPTAHAAANPDARRPTLVALGCGRADFEGPRPEADAARGIPSFGDVTLPNGEKPCIECPNAGPHDPYRRTFVSEIDGSVQSYAIVPPAKSDTDKSKIGLVLSLHGASVECMNQAKSYAPKPDFWIVCPTNRGNFGFDWQDWGRLDAYEVLEDALRVTGVDPRRVYLTGHSMGGHGTWHLAANDPGRFLAIAPSAGWSSFDSYGAPKVMSPLTWMWRAADGASRTMELIDNLAQIPTYVLHGEKDDNVPASEARMMIDAITKAGGKPESHFEPDAGHWWDDPKTPGAECVDWPGMWELFGKTQPPEQPPRDLAITELDSSIPIEIPWLSFDPLEVGRPSRVRARWSEDNIVTISTENVRTISLIDVGSPGGSPESDELVCIVDGAKLQLSHRRSYWYEIVRNSKSSSWTLDRGLRVYSRMGDAPQPRARRRSGLAGGPFKHAFTNRFVLVYGTAGDDAEDRELLEKARYDSLVWAYRANGDANVMSDGQFLTGDFKDRNVIVYGNADTNKAWSAVFDDDCPITAKRGTITVGDAKHDGVVAAAFVRPRKGSAYALAAAFADTGAAATRLFYSFPVFGSGFGIPDYVVFGPGYLKEMDGDVRAAGWFDHTWRLR